MITNAPASTSARLAATEMPKRIAVLPRDKRGYPIPRFIDRSADIDGEPDFRVMNGKYLAECIKKQKCWICGDVLGRYKTFAIGPMCVVNRVTSEPPSHLDCCLYSVKVCPFLSNPEMRRIDHNLPDDAWVSGIAIERNPGVTCLWTTFYYSTFKPANGGILFQIGEPQSISWWTRGREAMPLEIHHSIESGFPLLEAAAKSDPKPVEAIMELQKAMRTARQYLPN